MCLNKHKQSRKTHIILFDCAILRAPSAEDDSQSNEIVLHCPTEFDQRYAIDGRDSFLSVFQLRFANMDRKNTFRIYEVPNDLKIYTMTLKDRKYGLIKLPAEEFRTPEREIAGSDEYKKEEDDFYNSEEDDEESKTNSESEPEVADERRSKSIVGSVPNENSRTSVNTIKKTLLEKETRFDPDDLVQRESMMVFRSAAQPKPLTLEDFEITDFLGQGTFGKVYLTKLKSTGEKYAIKWIDRDILIEYDQEENTKLEEQILLTWDHEFVLGMDFVFENIETIYFVMPYVKGGELYKQLK